MSIKVTMIIKKIFSKIARKTTGERIKIGNFNLYIGRDHNLPAVLDRYPEYGSNLVRLAKIVSSKYQPLSIFDIGANVGDTAAVLLNDNKDYEIICVEGDEKYLNILKSNFENNKAISIEEAFLGDKNQTLNVEVNRKGGTLRLNAFKENKNNTVEIITLDSLIKRNSKCKNAKLLKIDTDGYDNQIIRGADVFLKETKPVIYFEYDCNLLKENKENGLEIFDVLKKYGYQDLVFFDNYGRFLVSVSIDEKAIIKQLDRYIGNRKGAFAFYDIIAFHTEDTDIARLFIEQEEKAN